MKILFVLFLLSLLFMAAECSQFWPDGQYCIPMPISGKCPNGWHSGYRKHDCENTNNQNSRSGYVPYLREFCQHYIDWGFCCKAHHHGTGGSGGASAVWPKGSYCIFRKGGHCPSGFNGGYIKWDDEYTSNMNSISGDLPDGTYGGTNTEIQFCCRNDGGSVITGFPKCRNLVLMRYKGSCPKMASSQYVGPQTGNIFWDTENSMNKKIGAAPDGQFAWTGLSIEFCTYMSNFDC